MNYENCGNERKRTDEKLQGNCRKEQTMMTEIMKFVQMKEK